MKSILILAVLATVPAMAFTPGENDIEASPTYLSWCDGSNVVGQNDQGQSVVRFNCADQGLVCKTTEVYRNEGSIVSAACVKPK